MSTSPDSSPRLLARRLARPSICAALLVALGAVDHDAAAQAAATDLKVKKPNVLLLVDTSGSMAWAIDGDGDPDYALGLGQKSRWTILTETLTGTVSGLFVDGGNDILVQSNGCRPVPNLTGSITTSLGASGASGALGPYTWPRFNGSPADKEPVAFCFNNDSRCFSATNWGSASKCRQTDPSDSSGGNKFVQAEDGLIDTYKDLLRFGIASFDTLDQLPNSHVTSSMRRDPWGAYNTAPWGLFNCNSLVAGEVCTLDDAYHSGSGTLNGTIPQWSYWHNAGGSQTWLNGVRSGYSGIVIQKDAAQSELFTTGAVDLGIKNTRALPWFGRLVGFGPAEWDLTASGLNPEIECNDEDTCTAEHNLMVQNVVLGLERNLQSNTPLAAMMRDTYEFVRNDTTTKGVHLPHRYSANVGSYADLYSEIGPQTDEFYEDASDRCRSTSVILVTDGEPSADYAERMSTYAALMLSQEDVKTYVIALGLDQATWNPGSGAVTINCQDLTAADLGPNQMCERSGNFWKYALPPNNTGADNSSIRACCNMLETAVEGGTDKPYFPANQTQLKSQLGQVLAGITGGSVSRTVPVFGGVSAAFAQSGGSTAAPATSYEIRSSMEVTADGTLWRGNLERLRYACNATDDPVIQTLAPNLGDSFGQNLPETTVWERKFFTVVTAEGDNMGGSIRAPSVNADDNLFDGGTEGDFRRLDGADDTPVPISSLATEIDTAWLAGSNNTYDILGISVTDAVPVVGDCATELGAILQTTCADRVMRWYGGDPNPDGGGTVATDPAPSRDPNSAQCEGSCSPLGAVYRSVPVMVPPPSIVENDDQNFSRQRTGATPSFVDLYGGRPTMLYSQTIDGQLHAFVVAKNQFTAPGSGIDFTTDVPNSDSLDNNELWTFIPPAVMPTLWDNFNTAARLLDGQLTWGNVVYERELGKDFTDDFEDVTTWPYNTVLVGCSGETQISNSFCYALDVTNPLEPEFLWQLSTSGDNGGDVDEPLFGDGVSGVAIAHIRVGDEVLAVAIIPGGSVDGVATKSRKRKSDPADYWSGDREPRAKVWDWSKKVDDGSDPDGDDDSKNGDDNLAARSVTFVELKTGRIIARMASKHSKDSPDALDSAVLVPEANTLFDSPFSGIPAVWPGGTRVAERVYIGDQDGTMWRLEIDSKDIQQWEAHIAFDAYNNGSSGDATLYDAWVPAGSGAGARLGLTPDDKAAAKMGQPIQQAPILSTDENGDVVVTFTTGDAENFNTVASGRVNLLISFTDRFDPTKDPSDDVDKTGFQAFVDATANGVELAWKDGGQVTGPLNLFDGQLYFSYYVPADVSGCGLGAGGMCGVNYVSRQASGEPVPAGTVDPGDITAPCLDFTDGSVVFGISVNLVPSCTIQETTFSDPWLSGNYKAVTEANAGRYELVFHTGQSGGTPEGGGQTKRNKVQLPQPKSRTTVRSFVRVAETDL